MTLPAADKSPLLKPLVMLAIPVLAEHALHILVGMTDAYVANNLIRTGGLSGAALENAHKVNSAAGAAVGSIIYITWLVGLIVSSIGSGATAIISRAIGAKHRRLANRVCGQSILAAGVAGIALWAVSGLLAEPLATLTRLPPDAAAYFASYIRILCFGFPFAVLMFTANSCLRGAGDTVTPAVAMITVDVVNVALSTSLTWGLFGMPELGFKGIAIGTTCAYVAGGVLQTAVLLIGRGGIRLFVHRLRPDWHTIRRILRIGLPSGSEGLLMWIGNFIVLQTVNSLGAISATAHTLAIRIESLSYMSGFAVATAVATTVGHNLGAQRPDRARRAAYIGYGIGAAMMAGLGVLFVCFSTWWARLFSDDPAVIEQTARCLFRTGFIQAGFASAIIFGSALRGAGDTRSVMFLNLVSILILRCGGVYVLGYFGADLPTIWIILCAELVVRGGLMYLRFTTGKWMHVKV
ncbi:MAG: MATE family efflux transporter [Burkholderiales bacterium]|nr:MATE family efflux transporter [Phycisphaerae bacterium]